MSGAFAVSVTCETCYIKGDVDARLTLGESFNINDTLHTLEDQASDVFDNITDWVHDFNVSFSDRTIDIPPPPDIDFNLPLDNMPEAVLEFSISGAEIYVELSTVFVDSITYRLTLYIQQGLGVELTDDLFLGLVPTLDLILSVDAELEIRHGFHIRFDEDILIKLAMFSEEAADLHL